MLLLFVHLADAHLHVTRHLSMCVSRRRMHAEYSSELMSTYGNGDGVAVADDDDGQHYRRRYDITTIVNVECSHHRMSRTKCRRILRH